jgi:hypothetical protein
MAISHVGTSVGSSGNTGTALGVNMPAGVQEGDVAYAIMGGSAGAARTITEDSGTWTQLGGGTLNATDTLVSSFALFRKVMGASPDASCACTASGNLTSRVGLIKVLRGVDTTTPEDATTTTATGIDSPDPDPASITTVTDGAWVIAFVGSTQGGTYTFPGDYGNTVSESAADNESSAAAADKLIATAGAEDPGIFDVGAGGAADSWVAFTVAARPAEVGRTGTMAATESGADDATASGAVVVAGTFAATEAGADDATMSGAVVVAGTLAATETGSDTFAGSGTVDGGEEPAPAQPAQPTYGAAPHTLDPRKVYAKYEEIEAIELRIRAKEEAEREKIAALEQEKRRLADLALKKRQTKTLLERRRKLEARIAAYQGEIAELRAAMVELLDQIERLRTEAELQQTVALRRRRLLLAVATAA